MVVPTSTAFSMAVDLQVSMTDGKSWVIPDGPGRISTLISLRFATLKYA